LQGEENSLKNQIAYLDNQIYLSELEIQSKESEIKVLSGDIGDLSTRLERIGNFLDYQGEIFANRARLAYASDQLSSFDIILGAENLDDALRRIKYLHVLEDQDIQALNDLRDTRASFKDQKKTLEDKKADVERLKREVEDQKANLIYQQSSKENLLTETRGQESAYQKRLKILEAERAAIIAALSQKGTKIGPVSRGQRIARQGKTGCATGNHIHYSIHKTSNLNITYNPGNYLNLSPGICQYTSYSRVVSDSLYRPASSCNALTQGYGGGHAAYDIVSGDGQVYASESGTAYLVKDSPTIYYNGQQMSFKSWCNNVVGAPYNGVGYGIKIVHPNGLTTSYWHIQP
jgi:hypothetical protein